MTIKTKILSLVAAFALLALAITGLSLSTMADYSRSIANYRHASENAFRGERLNRYLTAAAVDGRGIYMARTDAEARLAADQVDLRANTLNEFIQDWDARLKPGELPEFDRVHDEVLEFIKDGHTLAYMTRKQGLAAANDYGNQPVNRHVRESMQSSIDAMVSRIGAEQARSREALQKFESTRQLQFLAIAVSGILLLLAGALWLTIETITSPLSRVSESMIKISEGAYNTPIPTESKDNEIGQLWSALAILQSRAAEAERLTNEKLEEEHKLRELVLD